MATTSSKMRCLICGKEKATYKCEGCTQNYCKIHLQDHQRELEQQLDDIENERNIFRQTLSEQISQPIKQALIQQINQWERRSIKLIEQTAEEARQLIVKQTKKCFTKLDDKLNNLTEEIKDIRKENDFNETNLNELRDKLRKLEQQLNQPSSILLKEDNSSPFINPIAVKIITQILDIPATARWKQNAITIAGGNCVNDRLDQFNVPWGIDIDDEETIYVADTNNHRIVAWKKSATYGQVVAGGNGQGSGNHQLNQPTKVIIDNRNDYLIIADWGNKRVVRWPRYNGTFGEIIVEGVTCVSLILNKNGYLYVSDEEKDEVKRWKIGEKEGILVAGGNGRGDRLDQFNKPRHMCIDQNDALYVSDVCNNRVMKWNKGAREGVVVAGGKGQGNSLRQLSHPQGIFIDKLGTVYVADTFNCRIVRWVKNAQEGSIIAGGDGEENKPNQFNRPVDLTFDQNNNLYVVDACNNRIQKFLIDCEI